MSKRTFLAAIVLAASALILGASPATQAAPPVGWSPSSDAGFQGLPDRDPTSARFLVLSVADNSTLPGSLHGAGETCLALTFDPAVTGANARIALFDANSTGLWDQRVDGRLLTIAPNVRYTLFADPTGNAVDLLHDADPANDPTPVHEADAITDYNPDPTTDSAWATYYDAALVATPSAQTATGVYRFLLRMTLEPAPGRLLFDGSERVGHKVAFNGTYLLPAHASLGITGGAIDERTIVGLENQLIHHSFDPVTTLDPVPGSFHYNGVIQLHLRGAHACPGELIFYEADADYQAPTSQGGSLSDPLLNPTGIPPDNVAFYRLNNDPFPYRDLSAFLMLDPAPIGGLPRPIRWSLYPTASVDDTTAPHGSTTPANPPFTSSSHSGSGHPSYDSGVQPGVFETAALGQAPFLAEPGLWRLRWESIDKANFVFLRFNRDVGTTPPSPGVNGRVFCDANGDGDFDLGTDGSLGFGIDLSLQRVDCDTAAPIGLPIPLTTALDGTFSLPGAQPGCYDLSVVSAISYQPTGGITLPLRIEIGEETCSAEVEIGYACEQTLCGRVFCDIDEDCEYGEFDQPYAGQVTVVIQEIDLVGAPIGSPILVPVLDGLEWCSGPLPNGRYRVTVSGPEVLVTPGCSTQYVVDLNAETAGTPEAGPFDFALVCPQDVEVCGRAYCDNDGSRTWTPPADTGIAGLTIEARPSDQPLAPPTVTTVTGAAGTWCLTLEHGSWLINVVYPDAPLTDGIVPISTTSRIVVVGEEPVPPVEFVFNCEAALGGRVFIEGPTADCDGTYHALVDHPVAGVLVELLLGGNVIATTSTAADGSYAFTDLTAGLAYVVRVATSPGNALLLGHAAGPSPTQYQVDLPPGETVGGLDFAYCVREIGGRVFLEGPDADCDGVYEPAIDTPVVGLLIELVQGGSVVATTFTDASGRYAFSPVRPDLQVTTRVANTPANAAILGAAAGPTPPSWTILPGNTGSRQDLDFAYCLKELSGRFFYAPPTEDCDGEYDSGVDVPIPGLVVELVANGVVVKTTTTNAQGMYAFSGLTPGVAYTVRPANNPGNAAILAGMSGPTPTQRTVTPGTNDPLTGLDFAYCLRKLSGTVFYAPKTEDCDGVYDPGVDVPIPGLLIELVRNGAVVETTTTNAAGFYEFDGLELGATYSTRVANTPANALILAGKSGPTPPLHTVIVPALGADAVATLTGLDFEYCELRDLSGTVYKSLPHVDCDGVYHPGVDTPIPGVLVELVSNGIVVATDITDANGFYSFGNLSNGVAYTTRVANTPANNLLLTGMTGPTPTSWTVTPGTNDVLTGLDFGYCLREISGRVFYEPGHPDCDGTWHPGIDTPIPGLLIELVHNGGVVGTTLTGADGRYVFTGLILGESYTTRVANTPANALILAGKTGPTPLTWTVAIPASGAAAAALNNLDFAYCSTSELSGTVYISGPTVDCDGVYHPGVDAPVPGVLIELVVNGVVVDTTTTNAVGFYSFDELEGGVAYTTRVADTPANQVLLAGATGPTPLSWTVTPGTADPLTGLDFGYCLREISGRVFIEPGEPDCDGNWHPGVDTPVPGVLVELVREGVVVDTTLTGPDGRYSFAGLELGATYSTRVADSPANAALLAGTTGPTPLFWTVVIPANGAEAGGLNYLDFAYCLEEDCVLKACAQVYIEPLGHCDHVFTPGVDKWLEGAHVFIRRADDFNGYLKDAWTDANGRVCFEDMEPGRYVIYVGGFQHHLGMAKCDIFECPLTLRCGEDGECLINACEGCPRIPSCEGRVREADVEVDLYVCDAPADGGYLPFQISLSNVFGDALVLVDSLDTLANADGPLERSGVTGVIRVLSMEWTPWGAVRTRIRLTAQGDGYLPETPQMLTVRLGDDTAIGHVTWRAEKIRPGTWFTFQEGCTPLAPCKGAGEDMYQWLPTGECGARFLALEILGEDGWKACRGPRDPGCEPVTLRLNANGPCDWFKDGDARAIDVVVAADGADLPLDTLRLVFDGDSWAGEKTSDGGYLTILAVDRTIDLGVEHAIEGFCHCYWTVTVRLDRPCCWAKDPRTVGAWIKGKIDGVKTDSYRQDVCIANQ